jgi:hypothetical protein
MKFFSFRVKVKESSLFIKAKKDLQPKAKEALFKYRSSLEDYIRRCPFFKETFHPYKVEDDAPLIVKRMSRVSFQAGVGPMAAVAGALAEFVGMELLRYTDEVIVENGGDIFVKVNSPKLIGIHAGRSPWSGKLALEVLPRMMPLGVCTSAGTFGHSMSLGKADAVVVLSSSPPLADAVATKICNSIENEDDIPKGIEKARTIEGVQGVVIIKGEKLGVWGDVRLKSLDF